MSTYGVVDGCVATVSEFAFGKFRVTDIEVAILPALSGEALLGMNALKQIKIEQEDTPDATGPDTMPFPSSPDADPPR